MPRARCITVVAVLAAVLSTGCERSSGEASKQKAAAALQDVLAYPGSQPVTVTAGEDAGGLTLTTTASIQNVAAWYRTALALNGWELRSDAPTGDGGITIYADRGKQPLWILLKPHPDDRGTTYTLIGAVPRPDSAAPPGQRSGSSMSSKRIQRR
jgi:hypothetical protein